MTRYSFSLLALSLAVAMGLLSGTTHAFSRKFQRRAAPESITSSARPKSVMFSTPPENESGTGLDAFSDPLSSNKPPVSSSLPEGTSYPIDVPSPILLASSMILAIIGVGSGFDIFSETPRFPVVVNASISAGGLALCLGLFYASILKATAETEEDDRRYMNGR